jgi:hypothetical protein
MATDFGPGVSRTLNPIWRQFSGIVWQADAPPLDSDFNLLSQMEWERLRQAIKAVMPSGFLMDPTRALNDYEFNPNWTNIFSFGNPKSGEEYPVVWANVNGWIIPVAGTDALEGDLRNLIKLYPPPESDTRVDLVFLEAWQTRVDPNPSTVNKPTAATLYKYGNVKYGGTNLTDDLEDPAIGFETTGRIQVQYRLRIFGSGVGLGAGVALDKHPDGLGDPNIWGQGTNASPQSGMIWENMREELGDPSLWRAGDGDENNALGTIDGYTYAIPVCALFRRNSNVYVAYNEAGNPNQNGGFLRTPGNSFLIDPLAGARLLTSATLTSDLSPTARVAAPVTIDITDLNGSGLEDTHHILSSTFLVVGDEIVGIDNVNLIASTITIPAGGRGRYGTAAIGHPMGTSVQFYNSRPDGLFADQIAGTDILDLRRAVNPGDWDFHRLLTHNVAALAQGNLRSTWKNSGAGDTDGVTVHEVDELWAGGAASPNHTDPVDGPDGVRTVFSDAAAIQPDVNLLCDNEASLGADNFTTDQFDTTVRWETAPDFKPIGFMNNGTDSIYPAEEAWTNGSTVLMFIGGADGAHGARGTFRDGSDRAVRFVMPKEYWKTSFPAPEQGNQHPVAIRFIGERALEPAPPVPSPDPCAPPSEEASPEVARHVGPMVPWRDTNFERPFITLGGILASGLRLSRPVTDLVVTGGTIFEIDVGINFDTPGGYFSKSNDNFNNDPALVAQPLLRGQRTLYGMLTDNGRDQTGASSEVYVVLYGDPASSNNNGAFKVIGAGQATGSGGAGYTAHHATNATSLVVEPLSTDFTTFDALTGNSVVIEFRSPYHNAEDTSDFGARFADLAIVLTDIGGLDCDHPWCREDLGYTTDYDLSMPQTDPGSLGGPTRAAVPSKMLIDLSLLYHPGRGAMARIPDEIARFSMRGGVTETIGAYLRQSPAVVDTTFSSFSGAPPNESFFDWAHVQTWNRLPALGLHAPGAPNYGGNVVGFTEQDREHELFVDRGSKSVVFRPFRDREMTVHGMTFTTSILENGCLLGSYAYPDTTPKDSMVLFTGTATSGKRMGFPVPREYMPRFGRQDIPYWVDVNEGAGPYLPGINHLFRDSGTLNEPVFNIIGGTPNLSGGNQVNPMFFATGQPTEYAHSGTHIDPMSIRPFYGARRTGDIDPNVQYAQDIVDRLAAVSSSDLGQGLEGIQLPPYLGIVRLYGVFEEDDYTAKGGRTFKSNRYEMETDPATNLLREDATQQTLFILQDGAKDFTQEGCDHTYIIPSNVLDLARIPGYAAGQRFDDFHYVVECTVYGFSKGFIDQNNYALFRGFNGEGKGASGSVNGNIDGDNPELESVHMVIPCPAGSNDHFYVAYNRTVYQGDPWMTRSGEVMTTSDYEARYGQIPMASQHALKTPIQQVEPGTGEPAIETPNARAFEVLASMDFYTTLGTGKIGGDLFPGTPLDIGFTQQEGASRLPASSTEPPWRILTRAYSEGQKHNKSRGMLGLELLNEGSNLPALNPAEGSWAVLRITRLDGQVVDLYGSTDAHLAALQAAPWNVPSSDIFRVDTDSDTTQYTATTSDFGYVDLGSMNSHPFSVPGAQVGDSVIVNPDADHPGVYYQGRVSAPDTVMITAHNTHPDMPFEAIVEAGSVGDAIGDVHNAVRTVDITWTGGSIPAWETRSVNVTVTGVKAGDLIVTDPSSFLVGLDEDQNTDVYGVATADDTVRFTVVNENSISIDPPSLTAVLIAILRNFDAPDPVDLTNVTCAVRVIHSEGSLAQTTTNLENLINGHTDLLGTVKALSFGDNRLDLEAVPAGARGNDIEVSIRHTGSPTTVVQDALRLLAPRTDARALGAVITSSNLIGGLDEPVNAGSGTNPLSMIGMTERLPLGILLQDSDFLCENPLGDKASAMQSRLSGPRPVQTLLPLTEGGEEFDRFLGAPGELVGMADGGILRYVAYSGAVPTGSRRFRLYRGGGSAFVLSGDNPGGPVDWVSESFSAALKPVLKGGALVCRAMLVRNYKETPFAQAVTMSEGDEIQMVVVTHGILGEVGSREEGITLEGAISPTGYGEGYAAADRYRIGGKPMFLGQSRQVPDPAEVTLARFPMTERE